MVVAPPIFYDKIIKQVPNGKVITTSQIREKIAKDEGVEITCPLTAGIFINICAWASYQRKDDITPYWRVLKADGSLNEKFPEACELQKKKLEEEGHIIISKGKTKLKYYVKDFEKNMYNI